MKYNLPFPPSTDQTWFYYEVLCVTDEPIARRWLFWFFMAEEVIQASVASEDALVAYQYTICQRRLYQRHGVNIASVQLYRAKVDVTAGQLMMQASGTLELMPWQP